MRARARLLGGEWCQIAIRMRRPRRRFNLQKSPGNLCSTRMIANSSLKEQKNPRALFCCDLQPWSQNLLGRVNFGTPTFTQAKEEEEEIKLP